MRTARCERCEQEEAVRVARRVWLCASCIRRALEARFPIFGLPLPELAAAAARFEGRRVMGSG